MSALPLSGDCKRGPHRVPLRQEVLEQEDISKEKGNVFEEPRVLQRQMPQLIFILLRRLSEDVPVQNKRQKGDVYGI